MFKFFHLCTSIILCYLILFSQAYAKIATPISGGIQIPIDSCTQVSLIRRKEVTANLESTLSSLGYNSYLLEAVFVGSARIPIAIGLNAADVWSKSPYSKLANWSYSERYPQLSPRQLNYRKYYDIITPNIGGQIGQIEEFFSNPMTMMINDYNNAIDKQAWTDNIASQLQGVTTSVDANGDGIIVEQGTCPSISITLDKPTVTACEAETGSLTINDPSGQSGTVVLTLPDASTQSFTYTGGAPAPIPFSYAVSEPVGSTLNFSATATSNSGKTSNQPATATANVIAGGLNVTVVPTKTSIEPNIHWCPDAKNPKCRRFQKLSARSTPLNINVQDSSGLPVVGANISLTVERVSTKFGGHNHDASTVATSTRPLGAISKVMDKGQGLYTATYTATEFSSEDKVQVNASFQGCTGTATSNTITSQVSGLTLLPEILPNIFVGGTNQHPGPNDKNKTQTPDTNHWVSLGTEIDMLLLMLAYPQVSNGAGLQINDISLPKGGKFDVNGRWMERDHKTHRRGIDVDMRLIDTQGQRILPNLQAIKFTDPSSYKFAGPHNGNHIHVSFER